MSRENPKGQKEIAYWGPPVVTAERESAWQIWKDDYLAACMKGWIEQGATEEDMLPATAVVTYELGLVDDLEWMPLGPALVNRMGPQVNHLAGHVEPLQGDAKVTYINALRTAQTSTERERTIAVAYHLGITVQQAQKIADHAAAAVKYREEPSRGGGERTALYRHFDAAGVLIYVGISKDLGARDEQHEMHSPWWRFSASREVEWFDDRQSAVRAEKHAIQSEHPVFNGTHNTKNRRAALDYLFAALDGARS